MKSKELPVTIELPALSASEVDTSQAKPAADATDWEKAFKVLVILHCSGFTQSNVISRDVDALRAKCGDAPADFMIQFFNSTRTKFMQDFMG